MAQYPLAPGHQRVPSLQPCRWQATDDAALVYLLNALIVGALLLVPAGLLVQGLSTSVWVGGVVGTGTGAHGDR